MGDEVEIRELQEGDLDAVVALVDATKDYCSGETAVRALDGVSLEVPAGSWVAVMGPSGSGKSTLLHCLAGLERVDEGRVVLAGQDITAASDAELTRLRRTEIGFAFQNFNLVSSLTAAQNVALPVRLAGIRPTREDISCSLGGRRSGRSGTPSSRPALRWSATARRAGAGDRNAAEGAVRR